jgi:arginine decarboxylase
VAIFFRLAQGLATPLPFSSSKGEITRLINTTSHMFVRSIPSAVPAELFPSPTFPPVLPAYFAVIDNHLHYKGLDVADLVEAAHADGAPLHIRHLPSLRQNVRQMQEWFRIARDRTGYPGALTLAFASKANPSQPVVKTLLESGTAYECSSTFDIDIVRHAATQGWVDRSRAIFINGFKIPSYRANVFRLRAEGFDHIVPIFDDLEEIGPFIDSGLTFDVGLRSRTDSNGDEVNRFGMDDDTMAEAADRIAHSDHLRLTTFHAMQTVSASRGLQYMAMITHSLRSYARLRRIAPSLHWFDIGGGTPARTAAMNHLDWLTQLLQTMMDVCDQEGVPVPDLVIESGRYLVQDHAFRVFEVFKARATEDGIPYYMINGSIMSTFPDAWALGDKFTVLPINGWDRAFEPARLAGITCDHDDVYPTHRMADAPLALPAFAEGLLVGFFDCGAYQETIGGRGGAKHCMLPEGPEIWVDDTDCGPVIVSEHCRQDRDSVLTHLGYQMPLPSTGR